MGCAISATVPRERDAEGVPPAGSQSNGRARRISTEGVGTQVPDKPVRVHAGETQDRGSGAVIANDQESEPRTPIGDDSFLQQGRVGSVVGTCRTGRGWRSLRRELACG